jgi:predicted nucleotidyltransferase
MGYIKGVPQGSILDPVLFNVFINDIFHFVQDSTIYNYADDNPLSYSDTNINTVALINCVGDSQMLLIYPLALLQ